MVSRLVRNLRTYQQWASLALGLWILAQTGCANFNWWRANERELTAFEDLPPQRPLPTADLRRHSQTKAGEGPTATKRLGSRDAGSQDIATKAVVKGPVKASLSDDSTEADPPPQNAVAEKNSTEKKAKTTPATKMLPRQSIEEMLESNWPIVASHVAKKLEEKQAQEEQKSTGNETTHFPNKHSAAVKEDKNQLRPLPSVNGNKSVDAESIARTMIEEVSPSDKPIVDSKVAPTTATSTNEAAAIKLAVAHLPAISETKNDSPAAYQSGDWLKQRDKTIAALEEEIRLAKKDAARHADVPHLETLLRLQFALAGRRDDAARAIEGLHTAEQEFWKHEAFGLVDLLSTDRLSSESRRFAVALQSLEEAHAQLATAGTLALRNMAFCRKVDDFGRVDKFEKNDFTRNQEVLLYVEARNFAASKVSAGYETELQGSFRVLDRAGTARSERMLPLDRQSCSNHRRDYYIAYRIYIPAELSPGAYSLELTIEDKKGNKSNNALLEFNVTK